MASNVQEFEDLKQAARGLPPGSRLSVAAERAKNLGRLRAKGFRSVGFGEKKAEEVIASLLRGDLGPLGRSIGLGLSVEEARCPMAGRVYDVARVGRSSSGMSPTGGSPLRCGGAAP